MTSQNVEIKAKIQNIESIITTAKKISSSEGTLLRQKDIFYNVNKAGNRLKLRQEDDGATLISYSRPDTEGPKLSKFRKCVISDPDGLASVLEDALGAKGQVMKDRLLFIVGQTRVHIDRVENLGNFMELEVMLKEDQSPEEGQLIAKQLMDQLGVPESDLIAGAYMDMLLPRT